MRGGLQGHRHRCHANRLENQGTEQDAIKLFEGVCHFKDLASAPEL